MTSNRLENKAHEGVFGGVPVMSRIPGAAYGMPFFSAPDDGGTGGVPPVPPQTESLPPEEIEFDLAKVLSNEKAKKTVTDWAERELVGPIKSKNQELLAKLTKYKYKDDDGQDAYLDPEEAVKAVKQVRANKSPDVEERINSAVSEAAKRKDQQIEQIAAERDAFKNRIETEIARRRGLMVDTELGKALEKSGIKPGKQHLHAQYLKQFVDVEATDNGEHIVVLGADGASRYGALGLMSLDEFINEYRSKEGVGEDWSPTGRSGSGSGPNGSRGTSLTVDPNLSPAERLKAWRRYQSAQR